MKNDQEDPKKPSTEIIDLKEDQEKIQPVNPPKEKQPENPLQPKSKSETKDINKHSLRKVKKVNYSEYFTDDVDNSEEYDLKEDFRRQKNAQPVVRKRNRSPKKPASQGEGGGKPKLEPKEGVAPVAVSEEKKEEKKSDHDQEKKKEKEDKNAPIGTVINIKEAIENIKNNNNKISNSDMILILFELCLNGQEQFQIEKDSSSRAFWEELGKKEELKFIMQTFKPETLRKYWRKIRLTKKFKKIIQAVKDYKDDLNHENVKLLSSINAVCDYVNGPRKGISFYINQYITHTSSKPKKVSVYDLSPNEQIREILNSFCHYFPNIAERDMLDILFATSFDIQNAYLYIKDKDNFAYLAFSKKEDEIILAADEKSNDYQDLLAAKGAELLTKRKCFLFNLDPQVEEKEKEKEAEKQDEGNKNKMEVEDEGKKEEDNKDKDKDKKEEDKKEEKGVEKKEEVKEEKKNEDKKNDEGKDVKKMEEEKPSTGS